MIETSTDQWPPKVPCPPQQCEYGECTLGCGTCCTCQGECHLEWDVRHAYIPETPEQHKASSEWDRIMADYTPVVFAPNA